MQPLPQDLDGQKAGSAQRVLKQMPKSVVGAFRSGLLRRRDSIVASRQAQQGKYRVLDLLNLELPLPRSPFG